MITENVNQPIKTILLVEDNPDHVELISIALQKIMPETRLINYFDGKEALEAIGLIPTAKSRYKLRPDLVLLDINLPKFGGLEVLQRIRAERRLDTMPVIILTSSALKNEIDTMMQMGADAFVTKSIDNFDLGEKIQMVLSSQSVKTV